MQDEITKHKKKILDTAKSPGHKFGEKAKEIFIEICIIVFAVTLSIWLHSWSEHRHEQKEAYAFLIGLKDDLTKDITLLEKNKKYIAEIDSNFKVILSLKGNERATPHDDSLKYSVRYNIPVTHLNVGRYEGFKSSGKLGTIENDSLKGNILVFYQQTMPELTYSESFVNSMQLKLLDFQVAKDDKISLRDFFTSTKIKSLFNLTAQNFDQNVQRYDVAIAEAKKIIAEIDEEVK